MIYAVTAELIDDSNDTRSFRIRAGSVVAAVEKCSAFLKEKDRKYRPFKIVKVEETSTADYLIQ
jgi:hypothetical protein